MISPEPIRGKSLKLPELFGKVLKEKRQQAGFSQEVLAFEAGFNRTFISMLERGIRQPTLTTLFRLGRALKVSSAELVSSVETEFPDYISEMDFSED